MDLAPLLDELPADRRLALAYAPAAARRDTLALLLLDQRLSRLVAPGREPLLAQVRLAWWRDRLGEPSGGFHHDEPVLALLAGWGEQRATLARLVDGWEALLDEEPLGDPAIASFAAGRGAGFAALATQLGHAGAADRAAAAAEAWALVDLALHSSDSTEAERVRLLAQQRDWASPALPRALRPLTVLHGLAARSRGERGLLERWGDVAAAVRLGLFGR